jgi:hypothetical protein
MLPSLLPLSPSDTLAFSYNGCRTHRFAPTIIFDEMCFSTTRFRYAVSENSTVSFLDQYIRQCIRFISLFVTSDSLRIG